MHDTRHSPTIAFDFVGLCSSLTVHHPPSSSSSLALFRFNHRKCDHFSQTYSPFVLLLHDVYRQWPIKTTNDGESARPTGSRVTSETLLRKNWKHACSRPQISARFTCRCFCCFKFATGRFRRRRRNLNLAKKAINSVLPLHTCTVLPQPRNKRESQ